MVEDERSQDDRVHDAHFSSMGKGTPPDDPFTVPGVIHVDPVPFHVIVQTAENCGLLEADTRVEDQDIPSRVIMQTLFDMVLPSASFVDVWSVPTVDLCSKPIRIRSYKVRLGKDILQTASSDIHLSGEKCPVCFTTRVGSAPSREDCREFINHLMVNYNSPLNNYNISRLIKALMDCICKCRLPYSVEHFICADAAELLVKAGKLKNQPVKEILIRGRSEKRTEGQRGNRSASSTLPGHRSKTDRDERQQEEQEEQEEQAMSFVADKNMIQ